MDGHGIDNWLNVYFPNSCISTNNGFSAPQPTGYSPSTGFTYGSNVSAGTIIYDAAHVYGINPEVILATLEKESSVVSGDASYHCQYINTAMGYGCLDSSACPVNPVTESGFSQQIIHAAWLLKFAEQRSMGNISWNVQVNNFPSTGDVWDNSDDPQSCYSGPMTQGVYALCPNGASSYFDGYDTIDGTSVYIQNGATAALYDYTPHFPGNENFDSIYVGWFGTLYTSAYTASQYSQAAYPQLNPGQQTTVYIEFQNVGGYTWYDDQSIGSAPAGNYPVHLGTAHPLNRASSFSSGWPTSSRPSLNFAAVYNSDGVTLASNQNVAQPGQIAKFSFTLTDPTNLPSGVYSEFFQPVAEGLGNGGFNDVSTFFNVTVNPTPALSYVDQSSDASIYPTGQDNTFIRFKNTGNVALYDDQSIGSAPAGNYPVHLATDSPLNRASSFSSGWPTSSRPSLNFAAVYNSDGVTLASNQNVAQPRQIIKFDFNLTPPSGFSAGSYNEYFTPILEGTSNGYFPDMAINVPITVTQTPVIAFSPVPSTIQINSNQEQTISFTVINNGNSTLDTSTQLVTPSGSPFQDPNWISNTMLLNGIGGSLAPAQAATLSIPILAPDTSSTISPSINLNFQQTNGTAIPSANQLSLNTIVNGTQYLLSNVKQSPYPALTYGQTSTVNFYYKNSGNQVWYDDTSLSSATTRDPKDIHLATTMPLNRGSGFDDSWFSNNRPDVNFTAVYTPDGVTPASNQHEVQPGQIVKFQFQITPSTALSPGTYREFFQPIIEGTADGGFNFPWTFQDITLAPPIYTATQVSQSPYPSLTPGQQTQSYIEFKNTGIAPWYDDSSFSQAPSNAYPVHLGTSHPLNSNSIFSSGWPTSSRPSLNFVAVYNSDGVTLASNQNVAQPGQIVKFNFTLTAPSNITPGSYQEFFQPIAEGTGNGLFNDVWTSFVITVN